MIDVGITKDDLHSLVEAIPTNQRALEKAYRLLSSVKDDEGALKPLPLPGPGMSYDAYLEFLNGHQLSPTDAEELEHQLDEFDRLDNQALDGEDASQWET